MNRLLGQALLVVVTASLATAVTPACAENDQSIFVRSALAPPTNRTNGVCVYQADPTQPVMSEGLLDTAVRDSYAIELLIGSQLMPRADQLNVRAEPNRAHIDGAVVKVTDPSGASIGEFTSLGNGFVDPGQNAAASYGLTGITAIDAPTAEKINVAPGASKLVVANIKVFGKTLGGVDLESGEFQFPIRVCNGCSIDFSSGDDPATDGRDCNLSLDGTAGGGTAGGGGGGNIVLPCRPGQDEATPCQICRDRQTSDGRFPCRGQ